MPPSSQSDPVFWQLPGVHTHLPIERVAEFPLLAAALAVWRETAVERLPATIDPLALPVAVIKGVSLFRRDPETGDWVVGLAGSLLTGGHGREMKGTGLADGFAPADLEAVRQGIDRAVERGEPELMRREFRDPEGRRWSFVRLLLQLSSDGVRRDRYAMVIDPDTFGAPFEE